MCEITTAIYKQIKALSIMAELEGMRAENTRRISEGASVAYEEHYFYDKAQEIADLIPK